MDYFRIYRIYALERFSKMTMKQLKRVNRVEVLEYENPRNARVYQNFNVENCVISLQDDGRTLKVFVYEKSIF